MTRDEALTLLNCSVKDLADMLGVKTQVVSMWKNKKIPLAREYQVRDLLEGRLPLQGKHNKAECESCEIKKVNQAA